MIRWFDRSIRIRLYVEDKDELEEDAKDEVEVKVKGWWQKHDSYIIFTWSLGARSHDIHDHQQVMGLEEKPRT
jgi:hypothetical protein